MEHYHTSPTSIAHPSAAHAHANDTGENTGKDWSKRISPANLSYIGFLLALCLVFWPVTTDLIRIWWTSSAHHHEMLALPIALFMVWYRRKGEPIPHLNRHGLTKGVMLAAPFILLMLAGSGYQISFFQHLALAGLMLSGFVGLHGEIHARYHMLSLLALFFMVPFGDILIPPLQSLTTAFIVFIFNLTQMDISRSDYYLTTNSGVFFVDRACAGIRFLMAALMISYIYGITTTKKWQAIFCFMALSAFIAIMANLFRAYGMVLIATLSNMRIATGIDHYYFGWILYLLTFAVIILMGKNLITRFDSPITPKEDKI